MTKQLDQERIAYLTKRLNSVGNTIDRAKVQEALDLLMNEEKPIRAHDDDGHFSADDPSTPNVNEAWKSGKSPRKKKSKKDED